MAGSAAWQIRRTENFERSLKDLVRSHYRKDRGALGAFTELLAKKLDTLSEGNPLPRCFPEAWPTGGFAEGWHFQKHYFSMPGLSGSAGQGRLMYLVHQRDHVIVLVWVYTHKEFDGRPSAEALRAVIAPETAASSD